MANCSETLRPEVKDLVEMGNGVGGIKVSGQDREAIRSKILQALATSKLRTLHQAIAAESP